MQKMIYLLLGLSQKLFIKNKTKTKRIENSITKYFPKGKRKIEIFWIKITRLGNHGVKGGEGERK